MDLMAAIGLLSSIVTLEEAGRSWVLIVKDKLKRKEIDINNWDSDDPLVQTCLLALTEIRNEKAAVLLDEFRIH